LPVERAAFLFFCDARHAGVQCVVAAKMLVAPTAAHERHLTTPNAFFADVFVPARRALVERIVRVRITLAARLAHEDIALRAARNARPVIEARAAHEDIAIVLVAVNEPFRLAVLTPAGGITRVDTVHLRQLTPPQLCTSQKA